MASSRRASLFEASSQRLYIYSNHTFNKLGSFFYLLYVYFLACVRMHSWETPKRGERETRDERERQETREKERTRNERRESTEKETTRNGGRETRDEKRRRRDERETRAGRAEAQAAGAGRERSKGKERETRELRGHDLVILHGLLFVHHFLPPLVRGHDLAVVLSLLFVDLFHGLLKIPVLLGREQGGRQGR